FDRAVGDVPRGPAELDVAREDLEWQVCGPELQLAGPIEYQRFRADDQDSSYESRLNQEPDREDRLSRFSEPHLVAQQGRVARYEEGDAFELIRERLERHLERLRPDQMIDRRLQQVEQPVSEEDRVGRRLRSDLRWPRDNRRPLGRFTYQ